MRRREQCVRVDGGDGDEFDGVLAGLLFFVVLLLLAFLRAGCPDADGRGALVLRAGGRVVGTVERRQLFNGWQEDRGIYEWPN